MQDQQEQVITMQKTPQPDPAALMQWYDRQARILPWRTSPADRAQGVRPNPYHVWLSEVMLQQTTVATVGPYFAKFLTLWPTVEALANARDEDVMAAWAGLGYYARARNLLKCARAVTELGGAFPDSEEGLLALPGIGPYTAAAIASIAFDRRAVVMDGNVERVVARLFAITTALPAAKPEMKAKADQLTPKERAGCHAQAMMDLGATLCSPKNPACGLCPWRDACAGRIAGIADTLPRKAPKKVKPKRFGICFVVLREDGAVLLETRPDKGLLGGMLGLPTTEWAEGKGLNATTEEIADASPVTSTDWQIVSAQARHIFTHFELTQQIYLLRVGMDCLPRLGKFYPDAKDRANDLPTAFKKALKIALAE